MALLPIRLTEDEWNETQDTIAALLAACKAARDHFLLLVSEGILACVDTSQLDAAIAKADTAEEE